LPFSASEPRFTFQALLVTTTTYSLIGTGANACTATTSIQVKVNACTGINELNSKAVLLSVYPNPNNGSFKIEGDKKMDLKLMNELGQFIRDIHLDANNNYQFVIEGLSGGIYFIKGTNDGNEIHHKIIVTN